MLRWGASHPIILSLHSSFNMSESASAFVQEGLSLQASYKDLILQAGEVDRRIELWNKAFDITSREAMQCTRHILP
jgi:hypothetical protein